MKQLLKLSILKIGELLYRNNDSKIIFYHDIHSDKKYTDMSTPMELFKEHIKIIKQNGFEIVPKITKKKNQIMITFDDGFKGLYDNFDYFIQNKIYVKLFLIVDYMKRDNYMDEKEIKELLNSGYLTIDSHTVGHKSLDILSSDEIKYQLNHSKKELEKIFEQPIEAICYPRGKFSIEVIEESKNAGYKKQYSCLPGSYFENSFENVYNRSLVQDATNKEFECILYGADKIFFKRYLKQQFKESHAS